MKSLLRVLLLLLVSSQSAAEIFKCNKDGQVVFQDTPCNPEPREIPPTSGGLGAILVVSVPQATFYSRPSDESDVVMKLKYGTPLTEISRVGPWVEVGIHKSGGQIAWVNGDQVVNSQAFTSETSQASAVGSPNFKRFKLAFNELNRRVKAQTGIVLFTDARDQGDGIVEVTVTDEWLSAPYVDQRRNIHTILNLWEAAEGTGLPVFVNVVDKNGRRVDSISNQ